MAHYEDSSCWYDRLNFMEHYHMRSNVESAFSMVKGKFGDSVRSKRLGIAGLKRGWVRFRSRTEHTTFTRPEAMDRGPLA